jgi:hypothetical protein
VIACSGRRVACTPHAHAPPREAEPFTRITRRCCAVRSLPLAPSSVPLIPSLQVRGLYREERTDHGRQPALVVSPSSRVAKTTRDLSQGPIITQSRCVLVLRLTVRVAYSTVTFRPLHSCPQTGQALASAALWILMNIPSLADVASKIDEKMFVIKYELSYRSR